MVSKTNQRKNLAKAWLQFEIFLFILTLFLIPILSTLLLSFAESFFGINASYNFEFANLTFSDFINIPFAKKNQAITLLLGIFLIIVYVAQFIWVAGDKIFGMEDGYTRSSKKEHGSQRWRRKSELNQDEDTMQVLVDVNGKISEINLPNNFLYRAWIEEGRIDSLKIPKSKLHQIEGIGGMMFSVMEKSNFSDLQVNYMDVSASNKLIFGVTRSGKGRRNIKPNLGLNIQLGNSLFVHDPKGELYESTMKLAEDEGYDVLTFNFKNVDNYIDENGETQTVTGLDMSASYNPLAYIYKLRWELGLEGASQSMLESVAHTLYFNPKQTGGDDYWTDAPKALFKTMAWILLEMRDKELFTIPAVYSMISEFIDLLEEEDPDDNYLQKFIRNVNRDNILRDFFKPAQSALASAETMGSVLSSATTKLQRWISSKSIKRLLSKSDFDFEDLVRKKVIIYAITPDGASVGDSIIAMMIDQLYSALTMYADGNIKNGKKLDRQFNFLLDEFGNFLQIKDFENKVTQCLSRDVRFWLYLQSPQQLEEIYGKTKTAIIIDNCHTLQYLKSTNEETNEKFSKRLGNFTISKDSLDKKGKISSTSTTQRALMTINELAQLEHTQSIVLRMTTNTVKYPECFPLPDFSQTNIRKVLDNGFETPPLFEGEVKLKQVPFNKLRRVNSLQKPEEILKEIRENGVQEAKVKDEEKSEIIEESKTYTLDELDKEHQKYLQKLINMEETTENEDFDSAIQDSYFAQHYTQEDEESIEEMEEKMSEGYLNCMYKIRKSLLGEEATDNGHI